MLVKTQAICLKSFLYKESSTIVSLLTEECGLRSFIITGGRKPSSKVKSSYFQPLQILEIVMYDNPKTTLNKIKECNILSNNLNINSSMIKISLSMFLTEVLLLSLKENNPNKEVFTFTKDCINYLNATTDDSFLRDFHIYFLYHLASYLGFDPMNNYCLETPLFDIQKGTFVSSIDSTTLDSKTSLLLHNFLNNISFDYNVFTQNATERRDLLSFFIRFFEEHITSSRHIQSSQILHTIF